MAEHSHARSTESRKSFVSLQNEQKIHMVKVTRYSCTLMKVFTVFLMWVNFRKVLDALVSSIIQALVCAPSSSYVTATYCVPELLNNVIVLAEMCLSLFQLAVESHFVVV